MTEYDIDREVFWQQLIGYIDVGRVIPVIGQDLLTIVDDVTGESMQLYSWMARNAAVSLGLAQEDLDGDDALNRLACRLLAQHKDVARLYAVLNPLLPRILKMEPPQPLKKLAEITPLDLFVSTTCDPLMEMAVKKRRPALPNAAGAPEPNVVAYWPGRVEDLPSSRSAATTIFHLFGRLSAVPEYAVTEEDVLEFIHSLGSEARRPIHLFDELADKHLLIIGSCFPDWLARFFIRTARRERLRNTGGKNDFFVDSRVCDDSSLVLFLKNFSTHTQIFTGGNACAFVDELHRRWTEAHPAASTPPSPQGRPSRSLRKANRPKIFLSYAHEDLAFAELMNHVLTIDAKLPVWFDKTSIGPGEKWRSALQRGIEQCSVFVPILSRHSLRQGKREFRNEWEVAFRVAAASAPTRQFIVPVVVDDTDLNHPDLLPIFGDLQWVRIGANEPQLSANHHLVAEIRRLHRGYQKETA
jgi:hypothetical protein